MPRSSHPPDPPSDPISPADTARYTAEMLESLRKIAVKQGQALLAHFLELAAVEAKAQANSQAQETLPPA
jgi:hypothetical protein